MTRTPPPCYKDKVDCPRRYVGCRAECEAWHEWLAAHEAERERIREVKNRELTVDDFLNKQGQRTRLRNQAQHEREKRRRQR